MVAMLLLSMALTQDKVDLENTRVFVYDSARGITFRVRTDGKVELTVREKDKEPRTYAEATAAEFRLKHPDLVRKYDLGRHLGGEAKPVTQDEFDEWWKALRRGMP